MITTQTTITMSTKKITITKQDREFIKMACEIASENIDRGGGPFGAVIVKDGEIVSTCLLYTSPSPRDKRQSRMPSSA